MIGRRGTLHTLHRSNRDGTQPKRAMIHRLVSIFSCIPTALFASSVACFLACASVASAADYARGLAASIEYDSTLIRIRARPNQSPTSPLLVRVSPSASNSQRIEFIGMVAGEYDLCEYLERDDGTPAALAPLPIRIVSQLPPDHGTDVLGEGETSFSLRAHYRSILIGVCIAWAAVPVVMLVRRAMTKVKPAEIATTPPRPTLAQELRAMLDAARAAPLSIAQRGRLELLLIHYWRARLELGDISPSNDQMPTRNTTDLGDHAREISLLRAHPSTRATVLGLERWLHRREGAPDTDAAALLDEFRTAELSSPTASPARTETVLVASEKGGRA